MRMYRLIPTRHLALLDFQVTGELWTGPGQSRKIVYLLRSSEARCVLAVYLDPAGIQESVLDLESWKMLLTRNPLLDSLEPDVEVLLINRMEQAPACFIVPIDTCSRLTGLLTARLRGMESSRKLWRAIDAFFADMQATASPTITVNNREATPRLIGRNDPAPEGPAEREPFF